MISKLRRPVRQARIGRNARKQSLVVWIMTAGLSVAGCASPATAPVVNARPLIGVYEPNATGTWSGLAKFASSAEFRPQIVSYYSGWYENFWSGFADTAARNGAIVLVQLDPTGVSLNSISNGSSDSYLRLFAESVKASRQTVLLSFGHEMNGTWYAWARGHVPPDDFVNAWRHIVQIFRNIGVSNVKWVWTVTSLNETSAALGAWWPGSSWVDFVGIDGYYYTGSATYRSVFGSMLSTIRTFSKAPSLITEVGIGPNSNRVGQIAALYAGASADNFSAIIWFDVTQHGGLYSQDWRLEDDSAAFSAFRRAVQRCCESSLTDS